MVIARGDFWLFTNVSFVYVLTKQYDRSLLELTSQIDVLIADEELLR